MQGFVDKSATKMILLASFFKYKNNANYFFTKSQHGSGLK